MINQAAENLDIEKKSGSLLAKKEYIPGTPNIPEEKDTTEDINKTEAELQKAYETNEKKSPKNIQPEIEKIRENRNNIPTKKREEKISSIFTNLGYDHTKYTTQIRNIANRPTAPTAEIIKEIITGSNTIANLSKEKGIRGKIFKFFKFDTDQIN